MNTTKEEIKSLLEWIETGIKEVHEELAKARSLNNGALWNAIRNLTNVVEALSAILELDQRYVKTKTIERAMLREQERV